MADKDSATQRKILEVRKKISLCEGKRRAVFNLGEVKCQIRLISYFYPLVDKEKKKNKEDTLEIFEEVKVSCKCINLLH